MAVLNLTEAKIRTLPLGSGIWRDDQVKGFMVICHKTAKTYAVQGDVRRNGRHIRTVRMKIDRVDRIGLRDARRQARELMSTIQSGVDPAAQKEETGITVKEALEVHLSERELRATTIHGYKTHVEKYLKKFKNRAIADITRQDVRDLSSTLRSRHGQTTASGVLRTLRALINTAMRLDESITSSPMVAVRIPAPKPRQVAELDLTWWWQKTETLTPVRRDLHRTMLLTGARKTSLLTLQRSDIDIENRVIRFRHMKTYGELLYPMGNFLAAMLENRLHDDLPVRSCWLWPSRRGQLKRVSEPKEPKKNLPSPHAYRHINRTLAIAAGVPYAESALLLGQRLPGASGGYVHPEHLVEQLRPHAQAIEDLVLSKRLTIKQTF